MFEVTERIFQNDKLVRETRKRFEHVIDAQEYMEKRREKFALRRLQAVEEGNGTVFLGVEQKFEILPVSEG